MSVFDESRVSPDAHKVPPMDTEDLRIDAPATDISESTIIPSPTIRKSFTETLDTQTCAPLTLRVPSISKSPRTTASAPTDTSEPTANDEPIIVEPRTLSCEPTIN